MFKHSNQRKFFVLSLIGITFIAAIISFWQVSYRLYPKINQTIIRIRYHLPGIRAKRIDQLYAQIISNILTGIITVKSIKTNSRNGQLDIMLRLKHKQELEPVLSQIQQRLSTVPNSLSSSLNPPEIFVESPDQHPFMIIAVSSDRLSHNQVILEVKHNIIQYFNNISGIKQVKVSGGDPTLFVHFLFNHLALFSRTRSHVLDRIKQTMPYYNFPPLNHSLDASLFLPGITDHFQSLLSIPDGPIMLKKIINIDDDSNQEKQSVNDDDRPAVMISVFLNKESNPLDVSKRLTKVINQLQKHYNNLFYFNKVTNTASYIQQAKFECIVTMFWSAIILATLIFFTFKNKLIALLAWGAIPFSTAWVIIGCVLLNLSFNLLTGLALVIAMTLVIDDVVIVLDSVMANLEQGQELKHAIELTLQGLNKPIVLMTFISFIVLWPGLWCMPEALYGLLAPCVWVVTIALLASICYALFIVPILIYYCNPSVQKNYRKRFRQSFYIKLTIRIIRYRMPIILLSVILLSLSLICWLKLKQIWVPDEDVRVLRVISTLPNSVSIQQLIATQKHISKVLLKNSAVRSVITLRGIPQPNQITAIVHCHSFAKTHITTQQLQQRWQKILPTFIHAPVRIIIPKLLPSSHDEPLSYALYTHGSHLALHKCAQKIIKEALKTGKFLYLYSLGNLLEPVTVLDYNFNRLRSFGITINNIKQTLNSLDPVQAVRTVNHHNYPTSLIIEQGSDRLSKLLNTFIKNKYGDLIPLRSLFNIHHYLTWQDYQRIQGMPAFIIQGQTHAKVSVAESMKTIEEVLQSCHDIKVNGRWIDQSREQKHLNQKIIICLLTVSVMLLVLLICFFQNTVMPIFILLISIPVAWGSATIMLSSLVGSISLYSFLALLLLIGLVTKQTVLWLSALPDNHGSTVYHIIETMKIRLRPMSLTLVAATCGLSPLLFVTGIGAAARFHLVCVLLFAGLLASIWNFLLLPIFSLLLKQKN